MSKKMSIVAKLYLLSAFMIANTIIVGLMSLEGIVSLVHNIEDIGHNSLHAVRRMTLIDMRHDGIRANVFSAMLAASGQLNTSPEDVMAELNGFSSDMQTYMKEIRGLKLSKEAQVAIDAALPQVEIFISIARDLNTAIFKGDKNRAAQIFITFLQSFKDLEGSLGDLGDLIEKQSDLVVATADVESKITIRNKVIFLGLSLLLGMLASYLVVRILSKNIQGTIESLTSATHSVTSAVTIIQDSSEQLSQATIQQSAAIEQTVSSMEEIAAMISQTSKFSDESQRVASDGAAEARLGTERTNRMSQAMAEITTNAESLQRIVGLINDIQAKTKVINDIVFETRLLSFNASIEAARAGVHGKGFAVVAEEVGKLATMSGKAADEIRQLLENSTREVSLVVSRIQERVISGRSTLEECIRAFGSMNETVDTIVKAVTSISQASKEQEGGVRQTNSAMNEMERLTQVNSEAAEALAREAKRLAAGAQGLNLAVASMRLLAFGEGSGSQDRGPSTDGGSHSGFLAPENSSASFKDSNSESSLKLAS